jgi:hypothetical protein
LAGFPAQAIPTFNLTFLAGTSAQEQAGFTTAANFWAAQFTDTVTIDLTVGTGSLGAGILAQAGSPDTLFSYNTVKAALAGNASSALDAAAVAGLPVGPNLAVYINRTSNNPNGSGSATPYVDSTGANTAHVYVANANAKALGLTPTPGTVAGCVGNCDGFIQFSTAFTWDFDASDGIAFGAYDFVGLAKHEIGHALGFVSGVDILDTNSPGVAGPFHDNLFTFITPLDLFRCSAASANAGADIDWTADTRVKSFSTDNCASTMGQFATGRIHGDGRQASHWKDNLGLGVMDPTAATGETLVVTLLDLQSLDVIGWELAVPEPGTMGVIGAGLLGLLAARRRRLA